MTDLSSVHKALTETGFKQVRSPLSLRYTGTISFKGRQIPINLDIFDKSFKRLPAIQLLERPTEIPSVCAHINHNGYLCYLRDDQAHLPRHNLGGAVLGCLEVAEQLLERLANGGALTDFQDEFPVYWGGLPLLIDIPEETKPGLLTDVALLKRPKSPESDCLYLLGRDASKLQVLYSRWGFEVLSPSLKMRVVDSDKPLGAMASTWPPKTLTDLKTWLLSDRNSAVKGLYDSVKDAFEHKLDKLLLLIRAPNTSCCVLIDIEYVRKMLPCRNAADFMRSVFRSSEKIDQSGVKVIKSRADRAAITRLEPMPADPGSWLTRNMPDSKAGLAGKNVLLIGCGAIGGHLADLLAKSGAGFVGGKLMLSDPDTLSVGNIGRHVLGFGDLEHKKTSSIRQQLFDCYPRIEVTEVTDQEVVATGMVGIDLVVDATGNQALSLYLNELKLKEKFDAPIVFAWVAGAGCGAQAYLFSNGKDACLNCLDYSVPGGSSSVMRKGYEMTLKNSAGSCGDWLVPFSATAAMHAAALATDLAVGWAKGKPNPRFRSITLDYEGGKTVKPISPTPNLKCPACAINH
ncbi:ThiF family adenylyltransferase [Pseudomonas sp. M20]|uniref:ThiF family adenylyltransferase n=1 Tax=Pseudomonas sp. M20 TaxID=3379129 RepID=UPI00386D9958